MSSFINICQSVHRKMRGGNAKPGTLPSVIPVPSVPAQDQMVYDIVDAVQLAWENLQNLHQGWLWMRKQGTFPTIATLRTYNLTQIRVTIPDYDWTVTFDASQGNAIFLNCFNTAATTRVDQPIWYIPYENWRGFKDRRPLTANGQPRFFTQWPDYTIEFDPTPGVSPGGGTYSIVTDYRKTNQSLQNSGDIPECPARFHEVIAWMAVEIICEQRGSTALLMQLAKRELYGEGPRQGRLTQLENDQLPQLLLSGRYA